MTTRMVRKKEALRKTGHSNTAFYRAIEAGHIPPGTKIGKQAVAWFEDELDAYVEMLRRQRDNPGPGGPGRPRKGIWPRLSLSETANTENPTA